MCSDSATRSPALRSRRHAPLHPLDVVIAHIAAVLVGGPIAKHSSPIAPELGDMGRWETCHQPRMSVAVIGPGS